VLAFLGKTKNTRNILLLQCHTVLSHFNLFNDQFEIAIIKRPPPTSQFNVSHLDFCHLALNFTDPKSTVSMLNFLHLTFSSI
jgi:hypothetical protein